MLAGRPEVSLVLDLDANKTLHCSISHEDLSRTLSNLLNNAIEALSPSGGTITLACRPYRGQVEIVVNDNGRGIPPEILQRLSLHNFSFGKEQFGNGLGLAQARDAVEKSGGSLDIRSKIGVGTQVRLILPLVT